MWRRVGIAGGGAGAVAAVVSVMVTSVVVLGLTDEPCDGGGVIGMSCGLKRVDMDVDLGV